MVTGIVGKWLAKLPKGKAVILSADDLRNSAKACLGSGFDCVRPEDIKKIIDEINSDEYPEFNIWECPDGRWVLAR